MNLTNEQANIPQNKAIGEIILEAFIDNNSIDELAEDYGTNCLMIEEIIRQILSSKYLRGNCEK